MSLLTQIKFDQRSLRLLSRSENHRAKATLLTTLIGEAEMVGKNDGNRESTDDEVIAVIKKFIKNINETLSHIDPNQSAYQIAIDERTVLEAYLPHQYTDDELATIIQAYIEEEDLTDARSMGKVMKFLKENHKGLYDGKVASDLTKTMLS